MAFHQFNQFTGRLMQSSHTQPLYPISPALLERVDPPKTMSYDPAKLMGKGAASSAAARSASSGSASYSTVSPKIAKGFKVFNSEMPVFLLGGKKDKILFGITFALVGVSALNNLYYLGTQAFK